MACFYSEKMHFFFVPGRLTERHDSRMQLGTHDGYADTSASSIVRNPPTDGVTQITSIVQPELISHASSNPCVAC